MRRLEITGYGALETALRMRDVPLPETGPRDLLVRLQAASINPIDYKIVAGALRSFHHLDFPSPIGFDGCGVVERTGTDVLGFAIGDRVYLRMTRDRMGSIAEYVALDHACAALAPGSITAAQAASLPLVGLTTVQGLVDRAHAEPGQRILIHAGSGGLGSFAVQYAKRVLQLDVTSTTSQRNVDFVRGLGADTVIAYDIEDYRKRAGRYDIVFDTLGGRTTADSFGVLKRGGSVVSVAGPPDRHFAAQVNAALPLAAAMWCMALPMELRARARGGRYFRYLTESRGEQLRQIAALVDAGTLRPVIDRVFAFEQSIDALRYLAAGHARGKVVIEIAA